jgi:hypothetical protein
MLPPVTGLRQVAQDSTGTTFSWLFVTDADAYDVTLDGADVGEVATTGVEVDPAPGNHTVGIAPVADPTPATTLAFTVPGQVQIPATPTGLAVTDLTPTSATVTCDTVPTAADYGLYFDGVLLAPQTTPVWDLTGLIPDSAHQVAVDASNSAGSSTPSAAVPFTTPAQGVPPPTPTGLAVSAVTSTTATVACNAESSASAYVLAVNGVPLAAQATPLWNLVDLDPSTLYSVDVDASNSEGTSPVSAALSFTTLPPGSPPPPSGSSTGLVLAGAGAVGLAALLLLGNRDKKAVATRR